MAASNEIARHVAVANSPLYVVDRFCSESQVYILSQKTAKSLIESLQKFTAVHSISNIVSRSNTYSVLVALYLKKDFEALQNAKNIQLEDKWYSEIVEFLCKKLESEAVTYSSSSIPATAYLSSKNHLSNIQSRVVKI